ncbi:MAG: hypothetical protein FWG94_05240 [Oscillospiraceae bacterium]|nr:hypothetical protein [Oscillospiraceae bacterium]
MIKTIDLKDAAERVAAIFFPERCVLCGKVVAYDDMWCGKCAFEKCGLLKFGCDFPHSFESALAGAEYNGATRDAVLRIKDTPEKRTLLFFANLMRDEILKNWGGVSFDLIVPVPINPSKLLSRGFNQAEKLAASLSPLLDIPVVGEAIMRFDDAQIQHTLSQAERRENAEAAYGPKDASGLRGKTVLLVDDVLTTGATLNACGKKLLAAGAAKVYAASATATRLRNQTPA